VSKFSQLFSKVLAKAGFAPQARYHAADRYSPDRTQLYGFPRDIRFDLQSADRNQLVLWSREMEQNNGVFQKLCDLFEQYTAGAKGLQFIPASSDTDWNKKARYFWTGWERYADLVTRQHFSTIQTLCARLWFVDGEVFILKTYGKDVNGVRRPRIQIIESHRVCSPAGQFDKASENQIYDGVEVNGIGRPVAYWVRSGKPGDQPARILAEDVVHIFEPSRANQYRGLPICYAVLNDLIDLDQLQTLEMLKAKENARTAKVVKTRNGEAPINEVRKMRYTDSGTTNTGASTQEARVRYLDKAFGGEITAIYPDEQYEEHRSESPSAGTQYHWDYLLSKICAGVGISKLLVFPFSVQGTVVRADLDTCAQFFRSRSEILSNAFQQIYQWVIDEAIFSNSNGIGAKVPSDYRRVKVRPPRSPNVDVGRNSNALISEYAAGWRTLESICGEMGEDYVEVLTQRAKEVSEARDIETEFNLPPGSLIKNVLDTLTSHADSSQQTEP
jgi:lambda family phage portal protein